MGNMLDFVSQFEKELRLHPKYPYIDVIFTCTVIMIDNMK